jgi:hypothetical protein
MQALQPQRRPFDPALNAPAGPTVPMLREILGRNNIDFEPLDGRPPLIRQNLIDLYMTLSHETRAFEEAGTQDPNPGAQNDGNAAQNDGNALASIREQLILSQATAAASELRALQAEEALASNPTLQIRAPFPEQLRNFGMADGMEDSSLKQYWSMAEKKQKETISSYFSGISNAKGGPKAPKEVIVLILDWNFVKLDSLLIGNANVRGSTSESFTNWKVAINLWLQYTNLPYPTHALKLNDYIKGIEELNSANPYSWPILFEAETKMRRTLHSYTDIGFDSFSINIDPLKTCLNEYRNTLFLSLALQSIPRQLLPGKRPTPPSPPQPAKVPKLYNTSVCMNWNRGKNCFLKDGKCSRSHKCAICEGNHKESDCSEKPNNPSA